MWLYTKLGYFEVTRGDHAREVCVAARTREDLQRLIAQHLPSLEGSIARSHSGCPYGVSVPIDLFTVALVRMVGDIDYREASPDALAGDDRQRFDLYGKVKALAGVPAAPRGNVALTTDRLAGDLRSSPGVRIGYGGVLFDRNGLVLVRRPSAASGEQSKWTFAKGGHKEGETAVQTALREVQEEMGVDAVVTGAVPGLYRGTRGVTGYFLMTCDEGAGHPMPHTAEVRWCTVEEAKALISQTQHEVLRERDLAVLEAAFATCNLGPQDIPAHTQLVVPGGGPGISGIRIPEQFYWVLRKDGLGHLAGMQRPTAAFPWKALEDAGIKEVVALHGKAYSPEPLSMLMHVQLEDLIHRGPPQDPVRELKKIKKVVKETVAALCDGRGVVVHCAGGRGRTGTVIGCVLRSLGYSADDVIARLDSIHRDRNRDGWPESPWQEQVVREWDNEVD